MIAVKGGKINTITNGIIENGVILIKNGKIAAVGENLEIPSEAEIIDASNMLVTPGLIDCHTHISTFGLPSTMPSETADGNEMTDPVTPELRAIDALHPEDFAVEKARNAGFTTLYTGPGSANIIGGTGVSFKPRGIIAEEMYIPNSDQMKMALGENPKRVYGTDNKAPMTRMGVAAILRKTLREALIYSEALKKAEKDESLAPKFDFKLEALVKVVRGEQKARIHCHRADDIVTAIRIAEEFNIDYSIEHATEGYKIKEFLAEKGIFCVVGPLLMTPNKKELANVKLETAGIMADAGVKVCLTADAAADTAWLPYHVGLAVRRGLKEEDAYKGLTIYPAELLGLSDRVGSIEVGKDADLAVFDGHPFSSMTLCRMTMIDGVVYNNTI